MSAGLKRHGDDCYPLTAPWLATPGPDFLAAAEALVGKVSEGTPPKVLHQTLMHLYKRALYSNGDVLMNVTERPGRRKPMTVLGGHFWSKTAGAIKGPQRAEIMVIGKMLGDEELNHCRHMVGPTGNVMLQTATDLGATGLSKWYVTNLLKTVHPAEGKGWRASWVKDFLPLLQQEVLLVRPKYILCLGTDASKALLGKQHTVSYMEGRVVELEYDIRRNAASDLEEYPPRKALVMTCIHPVQVIRAPETQTQFEFALSRFLQLTQGVRWDQEETDIDHRFVDNAAELRNLVDEVEAECEDRMIAVDAEWHGEHPQNVGSYVRSIQISWKEKTAAYIALRAPGGKPCFHPSPGVAIKLLRRLFRGKRVCGQFFNADLEWLIAEGLDLRPQFEAAETWEQQRDGEGGFDTGLAAHALEETDRFDLTTQSLRHTTAPRYDVPLDKWKKSWCTQNKLKPKDLEGYGECPDEVLVPYGNYDADVTYRIMKKQTRMLHGDRFGNDCWKPFWISQRAASAVCEIHTTGLLIDRKRVDSLTKVYMEAKEVLRNRIREWAKWPNLNIGSAYQIREFLFGEAFNGKQRKPDNLPIRLRPPDARCLRLTPVITTDKRPMAWSAVVQKGLVDEKTPCTNKMVLAILARESSAVQRVIRVKGKRRKIVRDYSQPVTWVRDFRFINQILQMMLRPPVRSKSDGSLLRDADGQLVYAGGLPAAICSDGRVRTHIYQTKETGRWSSARPPLQNLTKRREKDYKRILGPLYTYALRSVICAGPGRVLIESDYIGAELYGMAIMSGSALMIDHCQRAQLPEDHPNYYDIHSNVAVLAYGLTCEPTKSGLRDAGKAYLRDLAKTVIFGIAYGRGAKAIALAAKEEGVDITADEAQAIIDAIFQMYPELEPFFDECRSRALREKWLVGPLGRYRRFFRAEDKQAQGDLERQAMNFPIQGMIADQVSMAIYELWDYRRKHSDLDYRIAMQLHDAILLDVAAKDAHTVMKVVMPQCMERAMPVYPCELDGRPSGRGPYYLGSETGIYVHWGETMNPDECRERALSPKLAGWSRGERGWKHGNFRDKEWVDGQLVAMSN